jgi:hypothetical protein
MTQPITPANIQPAKLVAPGSRYLTQEVIYYGERKFLTFATYIRKPYKRNGSERVMLITKGVEYRPDLVSFQVFGYPDNWWRILEANGMKDIYEFKVGKTIIIPNQVF